MKNLKFISTIAFAFMMLLTFNVSAQDFVKLDKSPMDMAAFPASYKESNKLVKITYSRPQLKERNLEKLAPNGKVWRTGANEAPEITFYVPMKLGKTTIAPGTYSLFTIPGEKEWTVILSSDLNFWGSYSYDEENDVARLTVPVTSGNSLEAFSIAFEKSDDGVHMHLGWDKMRIAVPFTK